MQVGTDLAWWQKRGGKRGKALSTCIMKRNFITGEQKKNVFSQ